jgi:capsular exopolysaccharide synthesis family protein
MSDNLSGNIPQTPTSPKSELFSLSLRDLFYKYVRFLPVFILAVAFALFVSYIYLRYATPYYNVTGSMHIKSEPQNTRSDKYDDIFLNAKTLNIQSEIEILKSRPLMERVVKKLGTNISYYAVGKIKIVNSYKQCPFELQCLEIADSGRTFTLNIVFNGEKFKVNNSKAEFGFGKAFQNSNGMFSLKRISGIGLSKEYNITWQPISAAAGGFASGLQVQPKAVGTGILNLSMITPNSQLGIDVINKVMSEYDSVTIEEKNIQAERAIRFMSERMDTLDIEIETIQTRLLKLRQQSGLIDLEKQSGSYFSTIFETDKQLNQSIEKQNEANQIEEYLSKEENKYAEFNLAPSSLSLQDATLNTLITAYNTEQATRKNNLEGNIPAQNPIIKQSEQQIEFYRQKILENLKSIKKQVGIAIGQLRRESSIAQEQVKLLPEKTKDVLEVERQLLVKQGLYDVLQKKKEETAISRASQISNSKIINKAAGSSEPVKPNKRTIQILAILLGLGLPAMFVFIREVLNDKIATRFDIEKITPAPILGEIGHSYSPKALVVTKTTRKMVAEQFRIIRSNLQYILGKSEKSTILVSSSFSGEGKSFVSTNIGAVLSLAGKKTIVLEFDIRKPKILSALEISKKPGITNFLVGKAEMKDLPILIPEYDNLYVLPCGPIPPNPAELLLDHKVDEMFEWLKANFDVVVIDTAPVGMVSDAQTLGKYADCTLYIVRQGYTFKKQVGLIDEFYQQQKLPRVSIIINDVKVKPGYGYYGYGRYGYGYGYGTTYGYYEEETPKGSFLDRLLSRLDIKKIFGKK